MVSRQMGLSGTNYTVLLSGKLVTRCTRSRQVGHVTDDVGVCVFQTAMVVMVYVVRKVAYFSGAVGLRNYTVY